MTTRGPESCDRKWLMRVQGQIAMKTKRAASAKTKTVLSLTVLPPAIAASMFLGRFYFVREALTFVGLAALLVFFALTFLVLGILFHEAARKIARSVRRVKPNIARAEKFASS